MEKVKNVVICGAGMMGNMIGLVFSSCPDFNVTIWNRREKPCLEVIEDNLNQLKDKGIITEAEVKDRMSRINFVFPDKGEESKMQILSSSALQKLWRPSRISSLN